MWHGNITATRLIENRLVLKSKKNAKMEKTISKRNSVKASETKPSGKPPSGYKSLELEPEIRFYQLEDVDNTE